MEERRTDGRFSISFPIRVEWKNENGEPVIEEGLTENVGRQGTLVHLPRKLPVVGSKVNLIVTEDARNEIAVTAQVLRLERNVAHPQVALLLLSGTRNWEKHVWKYAGELVAAQSPEDDDDLN